MLSTNSVATSAGILFLVNKHHVETGVSHS